MAKMKGMPCIPLCNLRIREDLGKKVLLMLEDPTKPGRTRYGAMRKYMETLIAEDMRKRSAISEDLLEEILNDNIAD